MNRRAVILSFLAPAIAVFAIAAWYVTRPAPVGEVPTVAPKIAATLVRSHSPILGPKEAPVTIVEFFDPACEACRAIHPVVKDILAKHRDAVRVVIRYTPFHGEGSETAIRVLEAARMQGIFVPVLEAILREQPKWAAHGRMRPDLVLAIAASVGLDVEAAKTQMLAPQTVGILNYDKEDVKTVGVRKTPTFFVNGKALDQFSESSLRALVAREVAAATGG